MIYKEEIIKIDNCGNPYIYLDYTNKYDFQKYKILAKKISDKISGLSSDGIITIEKLSEKKFRMKIFNSDGSLAKMCGNGLRGSVYYILFKRKYLLKKDISIKSKKNLEENISNHRLNKIQQKKNNFLVDKIFIETDSGMRPVYILYKNSINNIKRVEEKLSEIKYRENLNKLNDLKVITNVGIPEIFKKIKNIKINFNKINFNLYAVDIGNLHFIYFLNNVIDLDRFNKFNIENLFIFTHENFFSEEWNKNEEIVNVSILLKYKNNYYLRTRERGAGETLSCGTASASCAYILNLSGFNSNESKEDKNVKISFLNFLSSQYKNNKIFNKNLNLKNLNFYSIYHKGGIIKNLVINNKIYQIAKSKILFSGNYFYDE